MGTEYADCVPEYKWFEKLATFDLETTGIDVRTSRIVTANLSILGADGGVIERRDWLADPGIEIPPQASAVHGISTEMARKEGRPAIEVVAEVLQEVHRVLESGLALTVFNAPYDLTLLNFEAGRHGLEPISDPRPIVDPLVIDRELDRYRKGKRTLEIAAAVYGVSLEGAHDAGADAIAAGRIAQQFPERFPEVAEISGSELHELQVQWSRRQSESFAEYMRRTKDPNFRETAGWPLKQA